MGRDNRGGSLLERHELALETLAEQRENRISNMARSILDSKAEICKSNREKLDRDRERLAVRPRQQPRREAAAYLDYCHAD